MMAQIWGQTRNYRELMVQIVYQVEVQNQEETHIDRVQIISLPVAVEVILAAEEIEKFDFV
jgi:hypothetical protein